MEKDFSFYKEKKTDRIWWVYRPDVRGRMEISFDRKKILNLFEDYPWRFTPEEKRLFDKGNPYWADFFKSRTTGVSQIFSPQKLGDLL